MNSRLVQAVDLRISRVSEDRAEEMMALQQVVCDQLALPELYFPLTLEEMQEMLGPDGLCMGVEDGRRLVGFFGIVFMGDRPDNVGKDLGLPSQELPLVAYFKAVNVLPSHRAMGLQKKLTQALFEVMEVELPGRQDATQAGAGAASPGSVPAFKWMCSTVSPQNIASLKSFIDCGFVIEGLKPKYRGYMRFLMYRRRQCIFREPIETTAVALDDYARQTELLAQGWVGVRLDGSHNNFRIHYIRDKG